MVQEPRYHIYDSVRWIELQISTVKSIATARQTFKQIINFTPVRNLLSLNSFA